jgi:hypothetical protein
VFCLVRRKLGGLLTSLRERIRNLVKFHDHISPTLVEVRGREFRRTSFVAIGRALFRETIFFGCHEGC